MRTALSIVVVSFMASLLSASKEPYTSTSCQLKGLRPTERQILGSIASATPTNYWSRLPRPLLLALPVTRAHAHPMPTKHYCFEDAMIYNPRILVNQVVFRRDKKEGRLLPEVGPLWIPMESIENFSDGAIQLTSGTEVYVEEDNEQINSLIIRKLEEQEEYNKMMRDIDRLNIEPFESEDAE
jgi:uncharacterized protein YlzI (FlbEa/FlbD family)